MSPNTQRYSRMIDLYRQVRLMKTLSSAWRVVRTSCMQSSSITIRNEAIEFDADAIRQLKLIQTKLQRRNFNSCPSMESPKLALEKLRGLWLCAYYK